MFAWLLLLLFFVTPKRYQEKGVFGSLVYWLLLLFLLFFLFSLSLSTRQNEEVKILRSLLLLMNISMLVTPSIFCIA